MTSERTGRVNASASKHSLRFNFECKDQKNEPQGQIKVEMKGFLQFLEKFNRIGAGALVSIAYRASVYQSSVEM